MTSSQILRVKFYPSSHKLYKTQCYREDSIVCGDDRRAGLGFFLGFGVARSFVLLFGFSSSAFDDGRFLPSTDIDGPPLMPIQIKGEQLIEKRALELLLVLNVVVHTAEYVRQIRLDDNPRSAAPRRYSKPGLFNQRPLPLRAGLVVLWTK